MVLPCVGLQRSIIYNVLWLLFALSFLWFPYIGMVTLPCRQKPARRHTVAWSASRRESLPDYSNIVPRSSDENATILEIIKDQRKRMDSFCSSRNLPSTVYHEPTLQDLYHHLLVDDQRKIMFCYIPKVGCSNWKRVFLILARMVDPEEKLRPSIDIFRQVKSLEHYNPKEQEYRLRNYFKFMFVRHPPERVLSAYRNKIEHPLNTNPSEQSIWDDVRHSILSLYRMKFNTKMARHGEVFPSFSEFIHFLYESDPALMNEHYKPMVELCQPCAVKYNYVGNFATLRQDADSILEYLNINSSLFWDRGKHMMKATVSYVQQYFSELQEIDFRRLEERFADDISFYNYLFSFAYDGGYSELRKLL